MSYEFIHYEKKDHLARITINRPDVMNALHSEANLEMSAAFDDFAADPEMWVAIITGAGDKAFSAGNDLKAGLAQVGNGGFGGLTHRFDLFKPVIAAVNGIAFGGGFEIALSCDIIVASETARFGLPEPKVGLAALAGGMQRLPRQLPMKIAMGMMLTGKPMMAAEAARWGIVNEVVPAADLAATAERWAAEILECAPISVRATKQVAMLSQGLGLEESMNRPYSLVNDLFGSEDMREGPRAFREKRKPQWKGR